MNINGAIAAIKAFTEAANGNVVDSKEVMRRTAVCNTCPQRKRDTGFQTSISRTLGNLANKHRLPDEVKGKSCGVCGCSLMLLLPAAKEDLHKDSLEEAKRRPATCWMKPVDKPKHLR